MLLGDIRVTVLGGFEVRVCYKVGWDVFPVLLNTTVVGLILLGCGDVGSCCCALCRVSRVMCVECCLLFVVCGVAVCCAWAITAAAVVLARIAMVQQWYSSGAVAHHTVFHNRATCRKGRAFGCSSFQYALVISATTCIKGFVASLLTHSELKNNVPR